MSPTVSRFSIVRSARSIREPVAASRNVTSDTSEKESILLEVNRGRVVDVVGVDAQLFPHEGHEIAPLESHWMFLLS